MEVVFSSRDSQLKTFLGSTKNPIKQMAKSEVYGIFCADCRVELYIKQNERNVDARLEMHLKVAELAEKGSRVDGKKRV